MAKAAKKSKYKSLRDQGAVKAGKEQLEKKGGKGCLQFDGEFWRPNKGPNAFDIIPYEVSIDDHPKGVEPGELYQQLAYRVHYGIGAEERTLACPTSIGKKCPICQRRAELFKDPNADKDELDALRARDKVAFNVIDLDDPDGGIKVFDMSPHLFANTLYEELEDADGEFDSIFDLDGGFTVKARFKSKKLGKNEFLEVSRIDFEEREEAYPDSIVEDAIDLDKALNVLSYEEIEAIFLDEPLPESSEPAKRGEKPERTKPSRPAKKDQEEKPEDEQPECYGQYDKKDKTCRACGIKADCMEADVPIDNDEEPEEEEEPEPPKSSGKKPGKPAASGKCPHKLEFGTDCETDDVCDDCDEWAACKDAFDAGKKRK